jgi:hypothetical protein
LLSRHGFHDFELEENGSGKLSVSLATLGIRFMWSLREVANSLVLGKVTGQVATVGLYTMATTCIRAASSPREALGRAVTYGATLFAIGSPVISEGAEVLGWILGRRRAAS